MLVSFSPRMVRSAPFGGSYFSASSSRASGSDAGSSESGTDEASGLEDAMRRVMGGSRPEAGAGGADEAKLLGSGLKALVAEDDEMGRVLLRLFLERFGCEVVAVAEGEAALAAAEGVPFDLILLDERMPGRSGLEIARALREREREGARATIVAVSGRVERGFEEACREAGIDEALPKPVQLDAVEALVRRVASGPER